MVDHLILWGIIVHLGTDWLLQNEWQSVNKTSVRHLAAWVHSGLHFVAQSFVFGWKVSAILAVSHLIIDTRRPLQWWRALIGQTSDPKNPVSIHVAIWTDQVLHILCIVLAAVFLAR